MAKLYRVTVVTEVVVDVDPNQENPIEWSKQQAQQTVLCGRPLTGCQRINVKAIGSEKIIIDGI